MSSEMENADLICRLRLRVNLGPHGKREAAMSQDEVWRELDLLDRLGRIECERVGECGDDAHWVTVQGNLFVCDHHRAVLERQRRMDLERVRNADLEGMAA